MKIHKQMNETEFQSATGYLPVEDDLERVNCGKAGIEGHRNCGWNYKHNCPMFQNSDENEKGNQQS